MDNTRNPLDLGSVSAKEWEPRKELDASATINTLLNQPEPPATTHPVKHPPAVHPEATQTAQTQAQTQPEKAEPPSEEPTYTNDELFPLVDSLMNKGFVLYDFNLGSKRTVLKSRFTWEEREIFNRLDKMNFATAVAYQTELSSLMLAASIVQFGDFFSQPINVGAVDALSKSFDERYAFVSSLNNVFHGILDNKLFDFDNKLRYVMKHADELIKNF